jgi:hypothetical protein
LELATLAQIRTEVERRARIIGASGNSELPTYGESQDFGYPHIEVDSRGYHWVVVERGVERKRISTPDLDELLYAVFRPLTQHLASLDRCVKGEDSRRQMFRRQLELLAKLDPKWSARCAAEHRVILKENPFIDR